MKVELWKKEDLTGEWVATIKLDGINASFSKDGVYSRNGKPLNNLSKFITDTPFVAEIYCGSWENTVSKIKTKKQVDVFDSEVYRLDIIDPRLYIRSLMNPTSSEILDLLAEYNEKGYEGLVLRQGDVFLKVKASETFDVAITGLKPGSGRNKDRLGAFITPMGNVGIGLNDKQREEYYDPELIGSIIEVECMELTSSGKFRHPRFKRLRVDK